MKKPQIIARDLSKTYRVAERAPGLRASLRSLYRKRYRDVPAVQAISFAIQPGEMVGFIGPNGAGKTTALKMLAGLLHPSGGSARVAGYTPWERSPEYLRRISMLLGNKSQLLWDIPVVDSLHVLGEIYGVPARQRDAAIDELSALLSLEPLLTRPVRNLSLGERMKCELVAALLHQPAVLFLDEPTLGLDISMQRRLRRFIGDYNHRHGATIILTSHYLADVVELCPRVILIHHGQLLYDGPLAELAARLAPFKLIRLTTSRPLDTAQVTANWRGNTADIISQDNGSLTLRVARRETAAITAELLRTLPVVDLAVEEPPLEAIIDQVYEEGLT